MVQRPALAYTRVGGLTCHLTCITRSSYFRSRFGRCSSHLGSRRRYQPFGIGKGTDMSAGDTFIRDWFTIWLLIGLVGAGLIAWYYRRHPDDEAVERIEKRNNPAKSTETSAIHADHPGTPVDKPASVVDKPVAPMDHPAVLADGFKGTLPDSWRGLFAAVRDGGGDASTIKRDYRSLLIKLMIEEFEIPHTVAASLVTGNGSDNSATARAIVRQRAQRAAQEV